MGSNPYIARAIAGYAFDPALTARHMIFVAGPRQVGKTALARMWLAKNNCPGLYYNWDSPGTRQAWRQDSRFFESAARTVTAKEPWIAFDEIHKRPRWRDILKGIYDDFSDQFRFLITGSARLDLFRRAGDALVGRYNLFHMLPLSLAELCPQPAALTQGLAADSARLAAVLPEALVHRPGPELHDAFEHLWRFGPFPEPCLQANERFSRKWHQDYISLLVRDDLRDISRVVELDKIEHLAGLLAPRIGAPLSMANLAGDLEVAHTTVKTWLEQLRRLYLVFSVRPWAHKIARGLKRERKWYYLDWAYVPEGPARLENMVAAALYRSCHTLSDMGYGRYRLHYVRTLDKKEIDFLVCRDNRPILAVEVKSARTQLARPLADRNAWLHLPASVGIQVVDTPDILQRHGPDTWVMSAERLLALLP